MELKLLFCQGSDNKLTVSNPPPPLLSVRPLLKRVKGFAYTIHKTITKIVNKKVETFLLSVGRPGL